jgi:hypothetical protein
MSGAWGTGTFGLGPWGGLGGLGGGPPLGLTFAMATSTHTVIATLTEPPLAQSSISVGDALNPQTWSIVRGDTGAQLTILTVRMLSSIQFEIRTLEPLAGWRVSHTVSSTTLVDASGNTISSPESFTFPGLEAASKPYDDAGVTDFDAANPQTAGVPGTVTTTPGGDYATEGGAALAEKLIIRAITTSVGGFFHLPDYGFGMNNKLIVTPSKLGRLKADLIRTIEAIPVIDSAGVQTTWNNALGILTITVDAVLTNTGSTVQVVQSLSLNGGVQL